MEHFNSSEHMNVRKFYELDVTADSITAALAEAPIYIKKALVRARPAVAGELIRTVLRSGLVETENVAQKGQFVVTNVGGEQSIVRPEVFVARYEATTDEGVFRAREFVRAIANPTGSDIKIIAPWDREQFGAPNCKVVATVNPALQEMVGDDRYLIGGAEFEATYFMKEK